MHAGVCFMCLKPQFSFCGALHFWPLLYHNTLRCSPGLEFVMVLVLCCSQVSVLVFVVVCGAPCVFCSQLLSILFCQRVRWAGFSSVSDSLCSGRHTLLCCAATLWARAPQLSVF